MVVLWIVYTSKGAPPKWILIRCSIPVVFIAMDTEKMYLLLYTVTFSVTPMTDQLFQFTLLIYRLYPVVYATPQEAGRQVLVLGF